jgi:6-O-methylguanine DNA methyltransferase, DNA binding domain
MNFKVASGMRRTRAPWSAKLRPEMRPKVVEDPKGRGLMLLPTPLLVADEISKIPVGTVATMSALRSRLAGRFEANLTCPLMTGIFFNIIAGATEDQLASGAPPLAPWWRVVREDGLLSPKTPPGSARQAELLKAEGHAVAGRRDGFRVGIGSPV